MRKLLAATLLSTIIFLACTGAQSKGEMPLPTAEKEAASESAVTHWKGSFSNGMKGAKISFDVEGNTVKNLTFEGYWRCDGKLELTTLGPKKEYVIKGNSVDGTIKESGFYFELHGIFTGNKAGGTLRFAFVAGGCDTYKLNWTAEKK